MNRRELYAAGLPFGECATLPRAGGGYVCGGGGGGSSSSSTTTTTTQDKRMVVDQGVGISTESSQVQVDVTTLDAGIVGQALDAVNVGTAVNGEGFESLLNLASDLFDKGGALIDKTQTQAAAALDAINTAANDREGSIDQKTMIVLAVAGAAAVWAFKKG